VILSTQTLALYTIIYLLIGVRAASFKHSLLSVDVDVCMSLWNYVPIFDA